MHRSSWTLSQPPGKGATRLRAGTFVACNLIIFLLSARVFGAEESLQGPDVTIIAGEEKTIYEYRQGRELRMVKIVPAWGKPYYLVPRDQTSGYGDLEKADMLLPSWVIIEF